MREMDRARELAESIMSTAGKAGLRTHALLTDMNEVLGTTAGNALEIAESIRFLRNEFRDPRLEEVVVALCTEMLVASGLETDRGVAGEKVIAALGSGQAADRFDRMVAGLGGPPDFVETFEQHLPVAALTVPVYTDEPGYLASVDAFLVGNAIIELGGGRRKLGETLDLATGLSDIAAIGEQVDGQRPLAVIHASSEDAASRAAALVRQACEVAGSPPLDRPVIADTLTAGGG
jgi:thymidine phosphorylase